VTPPVALWALLTLVAPVAPPPVTISLSTYTGFAPLDVRVRLLVEPHEANRSVCVFVAGPLQESSSCFPHMPTEMRQRSVLFVRLPGGDYLFWAVLVRNDRTQHSSARIAAHIVSRGGE
jgi:hypothetical protein